VGGGGGVCLHGVFLGRLFFLVGFWVCFLWVGGGGGCGLLCVCCGGGDLVGVV